MDSTCRKENSEFKKTFSFGLKNGFPLSGMKDSVKNICYNGRKWFSLARKLF